VVGVDDAALGRDRLGHLVGVVRRRDAGADVEELADAGLAGQIADERARKARVLRTEATGPGKASTASSPASRSAWKWSLPPSQ
jgi:hypothetical protein